LGKALGGWIAVESISGHDWIETKPAKDDAFSWRYGSSGKKTVLLALAINEPAIQYQENESLLMNSLGIKGRQIFRLGSTNRPSYNKSR
jgi:hypothetical protein